MKAIHFPEETCVYAENQPEYLSLPTHKTDDGTVTSCYQPTFWERIRILFGAKIWVSLMTFNKPLQPQRVDIGKKMKIF